VKRACAVLLGSMLIASAALGVSSAAAAAAVTPAGYPPGSPAGSEYREQLAAAREIGARTGERPAVGSARHAAGSSLFGAGVTPAGARRSGAAAPGPGDADGAGPTPAADGGERAAIAAAARAPLDGPPASLITGLLIAGALAIAGMLVLLLRRRQGNPS